MGAAENKCDFSAHPTFLMDSEVILQISRKIDLVMGDIKLANL